MKRFFLFFLLCIFAVNYSFAQGELYISGESGFHLSGQIGSTKESTLIGISPGYTANGKVTFGLSLGLEDSKSMDLSSTAIRPYLGFLALKQGENNNPINLSIGGFFQHNIFNDIDDLTMNSIGISFGISHIIESSNNFKIAPLGGLRWTRSTLIDRYAPGHTDKYNMSAIGFHIGASFLINQFFFTPVIGFSEGESSFNLLFGYVFPQ